MDNKAQNTETLYYIVATNTKTGMREFMTYPASYKTAQTVLSKINHEHKTRVLSIEALDYGKAQERLTQIRQQIERETVSYAALHELEHYLQAYIDPSDTVLLEWAGVPEQ